MTLFDPLFELSRENGWFANGLARAFLPPADLVVSDSGLTVTMDVPGLSAESLDIELTGDVLTVRGERPYPKLEESALKWHRMERGYGKFQRTLRVPHGLSGDGVSASITDGVLTIHVPLPEARRPKRIQIATGGAQPAIETDTGDWQFEPDTPAQTPAEERELVGAAS
jgi:HSP20 family protein